MYLLENTMQQYPWGSARFLPELLGFNNNDQVPYAEMWMGSHPKAPSYIPELNQNLAQYLDKKELPFLFKLLAAGKPLSIQAHPDLDQAASGFQKENKKGIPIDAAHRNYRDSNHKPEIICALTEFEAMRGFRKPGDIIKLFELFNSSRLRKLSEPLNKNSLQDFFTQLLELPASKQSALAQEAAEAAAGIETPEFKWVVKLYDLYPEDIGILSPLFLNLIQMLPGQAMFLPAGELHAYLYGFGVELMANSDNVLRGGLTSKHIDIEELKSILRFDFTEPSFLATREISRHVQEYITRASEFRLRQIKARNPALPLNIAHTSLSILVNIASPVQLAHQGRNLWLGSGQAVFIEAASEYLDITAIEAEEILLFKADIP